MAVDFGTGVVFVQCPGCRVMVEDPDECPNCTRVARPPVAPPFGDLPLAFTTEDINGHTFFGNETECSDCGAPIDRAHARRCGS